MNVRRFPRSALLPVDLGLIGIALLASDLLRQTLGIVELGERGPLLAGPAIYVIALFVWLFSAVTHGVYQARYGRSFRAELLIVLRALITAFLMMAGLLYLSFRDLSRLLFIYFCLIDGVLLLGLRVSLGARLNDEAQNGAGPRRIVIIGAGRAATRLASLLKSREPAEFELVGFLTGVGETDASSPPSPVLGRVEDAADLVQRLKIDDVVFAVPIRDDARNMRIALDVESLQARVWVLPEQFDWAFSHVKVEDVGGVPMVGLGESRIDTFDRLVKRSLDVVLSGIMLAAISPVLLVIALAIRLDSPGPILFRQQRVGENWKLFQMFKFRSMRTDPDAELTGKSLPSADAIKVHKKRDDPRVTRVGAFIRRTSLDELPQLWNVLKGDMSLVGPRPELPYLAELYEPWQWGRFAVPQGITGWWQVNGRSDKPMHLHTEDDLYYVQHYSLLMDLRILVKTVGVLFTGRGAF